MSLIHDALKRAGEAGQGRRPSLPSPLSPVMPERSGRGSGAIRWVGLMVVVCFVVAGWYLWRDGKAGGGERQVESQPAAAVQSSMPDPVTPEAAAMEPVVSAPAGRPGPLAGDLSDPVALTLPVADAERLSLPSEIRVSTNLITRAVAGGEPSDGRVERADAAVGGVLPPELRLQSIIYRREAPMAMINGKTLVAGEKVLGVELLEVRPGSVLLRWQGSTQEMRLPDL
ncbi:MAG: hypothetical protein ACO34E_04555 [Limisphaerales bacterium]|jgi:hypothetical protein